MASKAAEICARADQFFKLAITKEHENLEQDLSELARALGVKDVSMKLDSLEPDVCGKDGKFIVVLDAKNFEIEPSKTKKSQDRFRAYIQKVKAMAGIEVAAFGIGTTDKDDAINWQLWIAEACAAQGMEVIKPFSGKLPHGWGCLVFVRHPGVSSEPE